MNDISVIVFMVVALLAGFVMVLYAALIVAGNTDNMNDLYFSSEYENKKLKHLDKESN